MQEFGLPIGNIDLLVFTARGDIAIVECKLASYPEIKRKVIGQVLEYGAQLWEMSYEEVDKRIRSPNGVSLADQVKQASNETGWDEEAFRSTVSDSLASGNFILIIVVDRIDEDLARILKFINACGKPNFEFAALEMRRFQAENAEMLVPRVLGPVRTATSTSKNGGSRKKWDEPSFMEVLESRGGNEAVRISSGGGINPFYRLSQIEVPVR